MDPIDVKAIPAGALLLIDTAPIVYVLEGHPEFGPQFAPIFEAHDAGLVNLAVTTVTVAEVLTGPMMNDRHDLSRAYRQLLESWIVVPLDVDTAATAARLRATYRFKLPDAVQAASAQMASAYALVTNDRIFSRVTSLRVIC